MKHAALGFTGLWTYLDGNTTGASFATLAFGLGAAEEPVVAGTYTGNDVGLGTGRLGCMNGSTAYVLGHGPSNPMFISRYAAADGTPLGASCRGGGATGMIAVDAATVARGGDVVVTGVYGGTGVDLGLGTEPSASGLFAARYRAADGSPVWVKTIPIATNFSTRVVPSSVVVADDGSTTILGTFTGTLSFGGFLRSTADTPLFLLHLGPDGAYLWDQMVTSQDTFQSSDAALTVDGHGDPYVAIAHSGTMTLPGKPARTAVGARDVVVAKFAAPDGSVRWSDAIGASGSSVGSALRVDVSPWGEILLLATTTTPWPRVDGVQLPRNVNDKGWFLVRYTGTGSVLSLNTFAAEYPASVDFDGSMGRYAFMYLTSQFQSWPVDMTGFRPVAVLQLH
ncbi:MAG: hypothetical protein U0169_07095 [Polyangiaceae bacterium]